MKTNSLLLATSLVALPLLGSVEIAAQASRQGTVHVEHCTGRELYARGILELENDILRWLQDDCSKPMCFARDLVMVA